MGNRIWELIGERAIQDQEELEFVIATQGSPYDEVTGMEGQQIAINPYIQYGGILSGLLENDSFLQSQEGKLLFHQAVYRDIRILSNADKKGTEPDVGEYYVFLSA